MDHLLKALHKRFPELTFVAGESFYWSPTSREVFYTDGANDISALWALLHETSHAALNHSRYGTDIELVRLEMSAWEHARTLGESVGLTIEDEHIQDCLDTYREWLYARSTCPRCNTKGVQINLSQYKCFNCHTSWNVTQSRFCRAYRTTRSAALSLRSPNLFYAPGD